MTYTIPDEPTKTRWGHLVVRPSGPLLAAMLCGSWMAWPWFVWNAIAMGSPTRRKEIAMCGVAIAGTVAMAFLFVYLWDRDIIDSTTGVRLFALGVATWKLGMAYAIETVQSRTFHVYEYYGGAVQSHYRVITVGYFVGYILLAGITDPFWVIIIAGGL